MPHSTLPDSRFTNSSFAFGLNQKTKRLGKRKQVTLIAGFKCHGGIVLCADTLEQAAPVKYSVEKLVLYEPIGVA